MRLYLDTADIEEVRSLASWGAFAGVTTTSAVPATLDEVVAETARTLADAHDGDIFVRVADASPDLLESRVRKMSEVVPSRLMVALDPTPSGLEVMSRLRDERIWTAAWDVIDLGQALLAANAGADVLMPSLSSIRRAGGLPDREVADMIDLCRNRGGRPRVLVTGIDFVCDVVTIARLGGWASSIPPRVACALLRGKPRADDPHEGGEAPNSAGLR